MEIYHISLTMQYPKEKYFPTVDGLVDIMRVSKMDVFPLPVKKRDRMPTLRSFVCTVSLIASGN